MKTIRNILSIAILLGSLFLYSCTDDWDSHYSEQQQIINNVNVTVVNTAILDYLKSESDLSSMNELFNETGSIDSMKTRDQLFTILVVKNENASTNYPDKKYLAQSHISDVSLSPANLSDGQRILMWHGKYLNVSKQENEDGETIISFNNSKVSKIIKLKDGYIYELESYVDSPQSMYEFIENLGEDYSIFKGLVQSKNKKVFDKKASLPVGVDDTGSTVYDSVFVVTNSYFTAKGLDLMSESITATLLLPSNEVIEKTRKEAMDNLNAWNLLGTHELQARADTIIDVFILQSTFFNQQYTKEDFESHEDLTSVFSRQWRTTVQKVNLEQPMYMSNGTVYYVTEMKIPTNVLIYRLKDFMKWYEFLTADDKTAYFASENLVFNKLETRVTEWSGWPEGGFPMITNRLLYFKMEDYSTPYKLDFIPFRYKDSGTGSYTITPYLVPPGEYDLCLGFEQNVGIAYWVAFNGTELREVTVSEQTATTYHYDRGGGSYPEGYDTAKATNSKKGNYDRDGGKIATVEITGTEAVPVKISIYTKGATEEGKTLRLHHWCLKPTKNCY